MVRIISEQLNNIPCLIVAKDKKVNTPLPTILYFHGYTSAKEHNLPLAYLLAEKGFRVVLPDSMHHGARNADLSTSELELAFWDIVIQNIKDIAALNEALNQKRLILNNRIGLAGTSMGGITASSALTKYSWIKTAVVLMGTPKITAYAEELVHDYKDHLPISEQMLTQLYETLSDYDLSKQLPLLNNRPLLFWHGEKDDVIPFEQAHSFYMEAVNHYDDKKLIQFIGEKNRDHKVSRLAILETVKWFQAHL
ncbi:esterase [Virgibacillus sp. W0430]|uniref:esterase n=1 Tax=Virgibacillus sp. W0430 TaxID=3391580 RepID=UPI003F48947E